MTTDDLLQIIPQTETKDWEFKAATIFDKANFGAFKSQKLGKLVSSFANSGGGFLLLGKRDGENVFDPVPAHEGRTTMEDHLSLVISQSVAPHYRDFEIIRVPISGTSGSVLVVEFSDSPVAPHQSVADTNYFYRLPGHSVPAPHFHLELLRSRFTKSVVEIVDVQFEQQTPEYRDSFAVLNFALRVTVENQSLQSATTWGVQIKSAQTDHRWSVTNARLSLTEGTCVRGEQQILLPSEKAVVTIHIHSEDRASPFRPVMKFVDLADEFATVLRPVSQNYVGRDILYKIDRSDVMRLRRSIEDGVP
jgi:hypothetical protein